ncbi:Hypothetical protein ZAZAV_33 [Cedratvirus Zaza IHUMI]|uniref:Uncharacterized protein n=1 Tax=Cedratvirus Zaza IHUMI TaxID=2126979 RepID=A0A2R8FCU3_9VIRU|nr:Hypothetical protein ZAZAV_33 [Cedratvirus Zaza IHUMI]
MSYFSQHVRLFPEGQRFCNRCWAPLLDHEKGNYCEHPSICKQMINDFVVRKLQDCSTGEMCIHYNWSGTWFPLLSKKTWNKCAKGCGREGPDTNFRYGTCLACHQKAEEKFAHKRISLEKFSAFDPHKPLSKEDEVYYKIAKAKISGDLEIYLDGEYEEIVERLVDRGHLATPSLGGGWTVSVHNTEAERDNAFEKDFRKNLISAYNQGRDCIYIEAKDKFINKLISQGHRVIHEGHGLCKVYIEPI